MEFLTYLLNTGVRYCLLGNTDKLPEEISSDIDIVISLEKFKNIYSVVNKFCKQYGCSIVQIIEYAFNARHFVLVFETDQPGYHLLQIDFCSSYGYGAKEFTTADILLQNSEFRAGKFWTLRPEYEFFYYFLKKTVKESINEEQFCYLQNVLSNSSENINAVLGDYFSGTTAVVIKDLFDNNDFDQLKSKLKSFRHELFANSSFNLSNYLLAKWNRIKRVCRPTGLTVCFLGRDGSGKSYVSDNAVLSLRLVFPCQHKIHLYPGLIFSNQKKGSKIHEPHAQRPRNYVLSLLKLMLFFAEYTVGYLIKIFPLKIRSGLIIFDRYYHDILIDRIRYRQAKMMNPTLAVASLIPSPDLCFIIDATSEVVVKRKGELTFEKAEELRKSYLNFAATHKNSIIIGNSDESEQANYQVQKSVLTFLNKRIINRYGA